VSVLEWVWMCLDARVYLSWPYRTHTMPLRFITNMHDRTDRAGPSHFIAIMPFTQHPPPPTPSLCLPHFQMTMRASNDPLSFSRVSRVFSLRVDDVEMREREGVRGLQFAQLLPLEWGISLQVGYSTSLPYTMHRVHRRRVQHHWAFLQIHRPPLLQPPLI